MQELHIILELDSYHLTFKILVALSEMFLPIVIVLSFYYNNKYRVLKYTA